jgi:hypothetical protein
MLEYLAVIKTSACRALQRLHHALLLVRVLLMHSFSRFLCNTQRIVSKRSGRHKAIVCFASNRGHSGAITSTSVRSNM